MFKDLKIGLRLYLLVAVLIIMMVLTAAMGFRVAKQSELGLDTVYKDRVVPLKDLKVIADSYAVNIVDTAHKVRNGNISWQEGSSNVTTAISTIQDKWMAYLATTLVPEEERLVEEAKPLMLSADKSIAKLQGILKSTDAQALEQYTVSELYPVIDPISGKFSELVDLQLEVARSEYEDASQAFKQGLIQSLAALVLTLIASIFLGRMITLGITRPVNQVASLAEAMAKGDFTGTISVTRNDEIGRMVTSLNSMTAKLSSMIKDIMDGVRNLSSSSTELAAISEQLSASATDSSHKSNTIAAASEELSTNMQSVSAAMEQSTNNISMIASSTEEMSATVREISQSAGNANTISANAVKQAFETSRKIKTLGDAAKKIGTVTEVITEISEQTNLLALNATIEAARAGDAGKGFAVVANEIKDLARQTAGATIDIKKQIDEMQETTSVTIEDITSISKIIDDINAAINGIASAAEQQTAATSEITNNISQASQGLAEVNENIAQTTVVATDISKEIAQIDEQSQQVGESSGQVQVSAYTLSSLSEQLNDLVSSFKVNA